MKRKQRFEPGMLLRYVGSTPSSITGMLLAVSDYVTDDYSNKHFSDVYVHILDRKGDVLDGCSCSCSGCWEILAE